MNKQGASIIQHDDSKPTEILYLHFTRYSREHAEIRNQKTGTESCSPPSLGWPDISARKMWKRLSTHRREHEYAPILIFTTILERNADCDHGGPNGYS